MSQQIFVFLTEAVAQQSTGFRPGARHALVILVSADDAAEAEERSIAAAHGNGWAQVVIRSGKPFSPDADADIDTTTRQALEAAAAEGQAILVFPDEISAEG